MKKETPHSSSLLAASGALPVGGPGLQGPSWQLCLVKS